MRKILLAVSLLALGWPGNAQAQIPADAAVCGFQSHVVIDPPASTTPQHDVHFASDEGVIHCAGYVSGSPVAPDPGTVSYSGTAGNEGLSAKLGGDQCAVGSGRGTFTYGIPLMGGATAMISGEFTYTRVAVGGTAQGTYDLGGFTVVFQFLPDEGQDCVNVPVSGATVIGELVLAGGY